MAEFLQTDLTIAVFAGGGGLCAIMCAVVCCFRDFARRSGRAHEKEREMSLAVVQKAVPHSASTDPTTTTGRLLGYQAPVRRLDPCMQYKRLGNNPERMFRLTTAAMPSASTDKLARAYGSLSGTAYVDDSPPTPSTSSREPRSKRNRDSAAADLEVGMRVNTASAEAPSRGSSAWSQRVDGSHTNARDVAAHVAKAASTRAALEQELGVAPSPGKRSRSARSRHRDETRALGAADALAREIHAGHATVQEVQTIGKPAAQGTLEVSVTPLPRPVATPASTAALAPKLAKTSDQLPKASKTKKADIDPAPPPVGASESTLESQDCGFVTSTSSSSSSEDEAKTPAERRTPLRGPTASAKASAALKSNLTKGGLVDAGDLLGHIELPSPLAGRSAPNRRGGESAKGDRQDKFDALDAEAMLDATLEARLDDKSFPNTHSGLPMSCPQEGGKSKARKDAASSRGSTPSRGRKVSAPLAGVGFVQPAR